jgi:hypothetical protein
MKITPASSRARRIADRLFAIGTDAPRSKLRIVESETDAAEARRSADQFNVARAARHCAGVMAVNMCQRYKTIKHK